MKVLYDYQGFMQRHGGVSRYFVELTQAMESLGGFEAVIPAFFTDNQYLSHKKIFLTSRPFKGKVRIMSAINRIASQRSLGSSYDLFHPTYFNSYFLPWLKSPFVITVHDMIHHLYGGDHVRDDGTRSNMRVLCGKAARVIAVSQATKDDLCKLIDIPDSKVVVVHHGTNLRYDSEQSLHAGRYMLYVGERGGYKNFEFFLSAAAPVMRTEQLYLVCVGSRPFAGDEKALMDRLGVRAQRSPHQCHDSRRTGEPVSLCIGSLLPLTPRRLWDTPSRSLCLRVPRCCKCDTFFSGSGCRRSRVF